MRGFAAHFLHTLQKENYCIMPIRMVDDPQDQEEQYHNDHRGGGGPQYPVGPRQSGGGGGGLGMLPMLLSLFGGKRLLLLLAVGLGLYFIMGRGGACNTGGGILNDIAKLATGGMLDPRQFEKASIYEPLASDDGKNPLPEAVSLQKFAPTPGNQGEQGSCVAWSSAYAARSILEAAKTNQPGDAVRFSPAFLYNQIGLDGCQGSYIIRAMEYMSKQGAVPYNTFPYTDQDCRRQPNQQMIQEAQQFKMRGFNRLSLGDRNDQIDLRAIKENLAQGAPVVIGMMVGPSFMQSMKGKDLWVPAPGDQQMMGFGGHAMCVVGYDDKRYSGSFLIMNSWGQEWGNNGFAWVRYGDFNYFVREAYGVDPMHQYGVQAAQQTLSAEVGLVEVAYDESKKKTIAKGYVPLKVKSGNQFQSVKPLIKGVSKFKMEVKNGSECYIYVFGKETDGRAYTLFPYPKADNPNESKYSPFCGITGYRLFPRDKSMQPDAVGKVDEMAIVISKKELNWSAITQSASQNPQLPFGDRMRTALGVSGAGNGSFSATTAGTMKISGTGDVLACIVEIEKN
jgi:hypothetical protein